MLKTVSSYLKRLRVYHLSNICFWKQHLEWKGTKVAILLDSLHACQVFSPAISTGMEKTQTLFISKLHGHIIKWKKAIFSVPSKSKNILLYHLIVRQVSLTGEKKPIALSDENYLQPQVVRWCCWWKDWRPPITVPEPSGRIVIQITLHFLLHFQQLKTSYLSCCICHTMLGLGKNW